jgi:hypothetical protein
MRAERRYQANCEGLGVGVGTVLRITTPATA